MIRLFFVFTLLVIGACTHGGNKALSEAEVKPSAPREMRHALVPATLPTPVQPRAAPVSRP